MHALAELVLPPTAKDRIKAAVDEVMHSFCKEKYDEFGQEQGREETADWWDWYVIGGRWSGQKVKDRLGPRLDEFGAELARREVTVSGVRAGKPELMPASQIEWVDKLWREWFPDAGPRCLLFKHSSDQYDGGGSADDVCRVKDLPVDYKVTRLILAAPDYTDASKLRATEMLVTELWNGRTWQETDWDGDVRKGLERLTRLTAPRDAVPPDLSEWLAVGVDYHN